MPGLKGRLGVRVADGQSDRLVTRYCQGLRFTKTAPGGHQSLSFRMTVPRNTFTDLGPADRVYVYDTRTTGTVIEGYLENPTPTDGPSGQQYDVAAVGGMALASDETRSLIYVDTALDGWADEIGPGSSPTANMKSGVVDDVPNTGIELQFPEGLTVATNTIIAAGYRRLATAGMTLGSVRIVSYAGKSDTGWRLEMYTDDGTVNAVGNSGGIITGAVPETFVAGTNFGASTRIVLQLRRDGLGTNIADDLTYGRLVGLTVMGQRMDRDGTLLTGTGTYGATALTVLASEVVEDLLGRVLTMCDPDAALVEATTFEIDQLAFPDGAKAADVLTALGDFEADWYWGIGATGANGLHDFWYRQWPTAPRYEVSVRDGWQQKGSDVDLCNRIAVSWTDVTGQPQTTIVTADDLGLVGIGLPVDALGDRVKDATPISLPDGYGSEANAIQIGSAVLTDKIDPPKAGTVLVRRPIRDLLTGSDVEPWEIEPGYPCRVRETGEALRVTQVDYDDDSVSSLLTLGTPVLTVDQRVVRLARAA